MGRKKFGRRKRNYYPQGEYWPRKKQQVAKLGSISAWLIRRPGVCERICENILIEFIQQKEFDFYNQVNHGKPLGVNKWKD